MRTAVKLHFLEQIPKKTRCSINHTLQDSLHKRSIPREPQGFCEEYMRIIGVDSIDHERLFCEAFPLRSSFPMAVDSAGAIFLSEINSRTLLTRTRQKCSQTWTFPPTDRNATNKKTMTPSLWKVESALCV